ncbi:MAG: hypothetical protein CXR31_14770 [Geobacter sp.]|nr:MAG: hypothetical protein CXR31_14770 [Geobacter sp.]
MAKMIRKKVGQPSSSFVETMNRLSAEQAMGKVNGVDDDIDFGFNNGPDYDDGDDEIDGPPFEPEDHDPSHYVTSQGMVHAPVPSRPPLMKPLMRSKTTTIEETPPATTPMSALQALPQPQPKKQVPASETIQLSCKLSVSHHKRLKMVALLSGRSVLEILQSWIDEHCPPLPEP